MPALRLDCAMSLRSTVIIFAALLAALAAPAQAGLTDVVMVVAKPSRFTTHETAKKTWLEGAGYTVTLLDDGASQATYDSTVSGKNVAYICVSASASSVGTKLKSKTLGIVNEHPDLA